jgi:hypothetical protein
MLITGGFRRSAAGLRLPVLVGVALVLGYLVALAWAMGNVSYDIWGAMVVGPVLVAITIPIVERAGRADADSAMTTILFIAFAAKMLGALVRYAVTFEIYAGRADAGGYHGSGRRLAAAFWDGQWDVVVNQEVREVVGTEFIRISTGVIYVITGPTKLGGFFVYSWLGFLGLLCFYRAFRVAFPAGDHRRYAIVLFFLPSLLYWPSSIGKEAWMLFTLGIVAYGVALVLTYRPHGYVVLVIGGIGTALVRPHVTLLAFAAFFVAMLLRRRPWRESQFGLLGRLAGLAVLVALGAAVLAVTARFFNVDSLDRSAVDQVLERAADQSAKGGSEFVAPRLASPAEYPYATATVLFRPFPWEAGNAQALVAAVEGAALMALCALSLPRLIRVPSTALRTPYVAFALVYTAIFVFAFSTIGNFGLLTRQRTQVLPFFVVLLAVRALPRARDRVSRREQDSVESEDRRMIGRLHRTHIAPLRRSA